MRTQTAAAIHAIGPRRYAAVVAEEASVGATPAGLKPDRDVKPAHRGCRTALLEADHAPPVCQ